MRRIAPLTLLVVLACHHDEQVGTIVGPPLRIERDASVPPAASSTPPVAPVAPVTAEVVDLDATGFHVDTAGCEQRILASVSGTVDVTVPLDKTQSALSKLAPGDVLVLQGKGGYDVRGPGTVVRAIARLQQCEPTRVGDIVGMRHQVRDVAPLTWAGGKMRAWLMVDRSEAGLDGSTYVGFLEGTAPVAEHVHEGSWEVLCAAAAAGEFTLAGQKARLASKTCVTVPPNTKHSWAPDPGSSLRAVQFYSPAGPEQRFRGLAAAELDAGVPKRDGGK